eukprot:6208555-Pleurochrysis_carterae.AAC.1
MIARSILSSHSPPTSVGWVVASLATLKPFAGCARPPRCLPYRFYFISSFAVFVVFRPKDGGWVSNLATRALATPSCPVGEEWRAATRRRGEECERATATRPFARSGVLTLYLDPFPVVRLIYPYDKRLVRGKLIGATAPKPCAPSDDHPRELRSAP